MENVLSAMAEQLGSMLVILGTALAVGWVCILRGWAFKPCTNEMRVAGFAGLETSISIVVDGKNSGTFAFRLASGHRHLCSVFRIIAN